jgi:hypothetical protein
MIARHLTHLIADRPASRGRPKVIAPDNERQLVDFCFLRQAEKWTGRIQDPIDFRSENNVQVDGFWVPRFVERNRAILAFQKAKLLEKERREVSAEDMKRYFEAVSMHVQNVPSIFVWNADGTRVGTPKREARPEVIVSSRTDPENCDNIRRARR